MSRAVYSGGAFYQVSVTGGGFEQLSQIGSGHHRIIGIDLFGTTQSSQLTITLKSAQPAYGSANIALQIGKINVHSGQLGGINAAGAANLLGNVTTLNGSVQTISFNNLGPNAQINVNGTVGSFSVGNINLSANGLVNITGDVTGQFSTGGVNLDGGKILIGQNVTGGLSLGGLAIEHGGQFLIGDDLDGSSTLGPVDINGGRFLVSQDVNGSITTGDFVLENTGQFIVGRDITGAVQVNGFATIKGNSLLQVGRDIDGATTITGNLNLDSGGSILVGRNVNKLTINGSLLFTPSAGTITVQGNLAGLTINGIYQGRANTSMASPEFIVGLDLTNPTVLGGAAGQGSIEGANISVGKDILGFDVAHGVFNSLITAGVLIDGAPQNAAAGGNISPDGTDAVFDSQILAGQTINNFEIDGNVHSDWVTNPTPTGLPTRIIAGEDRQGNWTSNGVIDNFQITGALIDSVLAASVQPYGGDGSLPPTGYTTRQPAAPPGPGVPTNYNAPAGTVEVGTFPKGNPNNMFVPNYSYLSYSNETLTGTAYNVGIDPNVHVNILPGAINKSFASTPLPSSVTGTGVPGMNGGVSITATTNFLAIPTKSTVLGGVISTSHGANPDGNDFAGIFAADTSGVFVGPLPNQAAAGSI